MIQNLLSKHFVIQTKKSKTEIFEDLANKIENQKKDKSIFSCELIDYRSFKIENNLIEVERGPNMFNPFRGLGTIYFRFEETNEETVIKCKCEPFLYLFLLIIIPVLILLIFMTSLIFSNATENYFEPALFILLCWLIGIGGPLLGQLYHRNALEAYSKTIMRDLDIK